MHKNTRGVLHGHNESYGRQSTRPQADALTRQLGVKLFFNFRAEKKYPQNCAKFLKQNKAEFDLFKAENSGH